MPETTEKRVLPAGWGFPGNSRKAHYFPEDTLTSLCGKWGFYAGHREADNSPSLDDCVGCRRKLEAEVPR